MAFITFESPAPAALELITAAQAFAPDHWRAVFTTPAGCISGQSYPDADGIPGIDDLMDYAPFVAWRASVRRSLNAASK